MVPASAFPSPDRADAVIGAAVLGLVNQGGSVTTRTLAGMRFGGLAGSRPLFDCEPVTFE